MSGQALTAGHRLGTYTVERVLGEGAFGITYLATNALGQRRSIKEFFPNGFAARGRSGEVTPNAGHEEAYDIALSRFSGEAKTVAGFDHPHIVKGLDLFEVNNTAYFAMPYYDGESLDHFLGNGETLDADEARHIFDRMSGALAYIHARDIVHRDIKPANIFILEDTSEPILIDFGAARISDSVSDVTGSDHYRAPEQTGLLDVAVSPASDIYGLAATLYRLVTGVLPADAAARIDAQKSGQSDPLIKLSGHKDLSGNFGDRFLKAIDAGLNLSPTHRPSNIAQWQALFTQHAPVQTSASAPQAPAESREAMGYMIEPEDQPIGRYIVFGLILLGILGGGGYLALNNLEFSKKDPVEQAQTAPNTPSVETDTKAEEAPKPKSRLTPAQAWVKALETDTLEGYREYLANFSSGANADKARAEIRRFDDEAFADAERQDTLSAYQSYIDAFPNGAHVAEAKAAMKAIQNARAAAQRRAAQEKAAWQKAAGDNTAASYQTYLDAYPSGANASEARSRIDTMNAKAADDRAFDTAKNLNTKTAYQSYMNSYPQGAHVPEAMQAMDKLTPRAGGDLQDCNVCPPLKILASGGFQQGAGPDDNLARSNEKPERRIDFTDMFAVGVTEVTFSQWNACVSDGGCTSVSDQGWGGGNLPVINVTWSQAKAYTDWLSQKTGQRYSLPSESQWEYAARAGEIRSFLGGGTKGVCVFANGAGKESGASWANPDCQDPAGDRTMPVGSLAPNKFGLKDVLGNVAEWTLDCSSLNYRDSPADGSANLRGSCRQRITRGGSWFAGPRDMRLSSRAAMRQNDKNEFTGFRVVRAVKN